MDHQDVLNRKLPGACRLYRERGALDLLNLSRALNRPGEGRTPSPVFRRSLTSRALAAGAGPDTARRAAEVGAAACAHHHGFDTHPEMVQGGLVFGLAPLLDQAADPPPVVVLAGASGPLFNPLGVGAALFARREASGRRLRLNFFPRSRGRIAAARAPALTRADLERTARRLETLPLTPRERMAGRRLFEDFLFHPEFPAGPDFPTQAAWVNRRLWAARFQARPHPELVFLDLEAVAGDCLAVDLADPDSPAHRVLFDPRIRERLLSRLAGERGCWSAGLLGTDRPPVGARGTVFFWALDGLGRPRALSLTADGILSSPEHLPLRPEAVASALAAGRIRPGLFLTFLTLAAHGLKTSGGVYMIDYHPRLLTAAEELLEIPLGAGEAPLLAAGPLPLGPAGALELLTVGPWPPAFWTALGRMRLADTWPATAREWILEEFLPDELAAVFPPPEKGRP